MNYSIKAMVYEKESPVLLKLVKNKQREFERILGGFLEVREVKQFVFLRGENKKRMILRKEGNHWGEVFEDNPLTVTSKKYEQIIKEF